MLGAGVTSWWDSSATWWLLWPDDDDVIATANEDETIHSSDWPQSCTYFFMLLQTLNTKDVLCFARCTVEAEYVSILPLTALSYVIDTLKNIELPGIQLSALIK